MRLMTTFSTFANFRIKSAQISPILGSGPKTTYNKDLGPSRPKNYISQDKFGTGPDNIEAKLRKSTFQIYSGRPLGRQTSFYMITS